MTNSKSTSLTASKINELIYLKTLSKGEASPQLKQSSLNRRASFFHLQVNTILSLDKFGSVIGSEVVCNDRIVSEDLIVINRKKMKEISLKQFTSSAF